MSTNNKITKYSTLIKNLILTNILWIVFSLPFFLLFFIMNSGNFSENLLFLRLITLVFSLLTFFSATSALFAVCRQIYLKKESPNIQMFYNYFKENFRQSSFGGIVFLVIGYLWESAMNFYNPSFFSNLLFLGLTILILGVIVNFFSVIVHMEVNLLFAFWNAIVFTALGNFYSIFINLINLVILYVSFYYFPVLILFISGSLIAYINFAGFYKQMFMTLYYKEQQGKNSEGNQ